MNLIKSSYVFFCLSGAGYVWRRWRNSHCFCRALCHPPHPHSECCRWSVAGQWASTRTHTQMSNCDDKDTYVSLNTVFYTHLNRLIYLVTVTHNKSATMLAYSGCSPCPLRWACTPSREAHESLKFKGVQKERPDVIAGWNGWEVKPTGACGRQRGGGEGILGPVLPWRLKLPSALLQATRCNPQ